MVDSASDAAASKAASPVAPNPTSSFQTPRAPDPAGILRELLANEQTQTAGAETFNLDLLRMRSFVPQQWEPVPHTGRLALVACCGTFLIGYSISLLNPCIGWISWNMGWCDERDSAPMGNYSNRCWLREGLVVWMIFVGTVVGSAIVSKVLKGGRRSLMFFTMWMHILGSISFVTANGVSSFSWARFLTGLGVGSSSVIAPIYLSEMTPQPTRGLYGMFNQVSITLGILAAQLLGLPLPYMEELPTQLISSSRPGWFVRVWWRVMGGFACIPALVCMYGLQSWFPYETPHYYLRLNRIKDARAVLQHVYSRDDVDAELEGMAAEVQGSRASARAQISTRRALRRKELRRVVLVGCTVSACQQLCGINVFVSGSTELLRAAGWTNSLPLVWSAAIFLVNVLMTFPAFYLMERTSRRGLIIAGCTGMAISLAPAAVGYWTDQYGNIAKWATLFGIMAFIMFFANTFGPILWVYIFEIFPVEIKGTTSSLVTLVSHWIAAVIAVGFGRFVTNRYVFTVFAGINVCIAIISIFFVRETKGLKGNESPYVKKTFISLSSSGN
eukprot:Gregarina_sp_Poly_1__6962@NODE_378_length_9084_cov_115_952201_g311_i0_p2_GENE_NODE_378_length_9084_cov_115_952201_g311_i0NODE_378_length_9084_cov_115_952201_g311_i0_p2_ORF_typecomplete_len558_score58_02Sugar_tr/PF00083_24/2_9e87MFS_1/PF07690_16/8_6e02MFS_1/PF07690_16/1_3e10MFS_1/PF07690_16/2_3e09TRI12/PF06609_13/1_4e05TRI12/PF06609_13/3_7e03TRI12/PF06609_13/1_6e02DUF2157/PF09925_9/0_11DUF2157/PF09925_9/17DUF2157/PF09925_9/3_7e02_NODE_378_length_9084_cov_115_952201_g311_i040305703